MSEEPLKHVSKKRIIAAAKYVVAIALLWMVFQQIDTRSLTQHVASINPFYLVAAFVSFTIAQIASSARMVAYYEYAGKPIDQRYNLILHYVGLFYNIILPGGIGGDGYKVYLLKKKADYPAKEGIRIQLATRTNGLLVLVLSIYATFFFIPIPIPLILKWPAIIAFSLITIIAYFFLARKILKMPQAMEGRALPYSLAVQGLNVLAMSLLWLAMGQSDHLVAYILLFQLAAIAGMIPITIGGLGIREMTFFYGAALISTYTPMEVDGEVGIAISLMIFAITLVSATVGLRWIHTISDMSPCEKYSQTV